MVSGWTSQQSEQLGGDGLSHPQRLIWAGQQLHPDVPLYNMAFAFTIRGALDPETFQDAFGHVVEQSDALRSVFIVDDGVPVRRLLDGPFELPLVDWSAEDLTDADVMERLRDWAVQPFDPGNRLFDSALIELAPDRFVWYFSEHHIIADAWSMGLLYRRTAEAYRAILDGTTPPGNDRSYQELVEFERSEVGRSGADRARAHWTEQLRSVDAPPALYGGRRRDGSTASARITRTLSTAQSDALRALSEHPDLGLVVEKIVL